MKLNDVIFNVNITPFYSVKVKLEFLLVRLTLILQTWFSCDSLNVDITDISKNLQKKLKILIKNIMHVILVGLFHAFPMIWRFFCQYGSIGVIHIRKKCASTKGNHLVCLTLRYISNPNHLSNVEFLSINQNMR